MKTTRLITRRRALVDRGWHRLGGLVACALPQGPAADLRQPAARGRHLHVRRPPDAAAATRRWSRNTVTPTSRRSPPRARRIPVRPEAHGEATPIDACEHGRFADWRLAVEGRVARPRTFSLADAETAARADADHAAHVRRRLDRHRAVDRRAARALCSTRRASCRPHDL